HLLHDPLELVDAEPAQHGGAEDAPISLLDPHREPDLALAVEERGPTDLAKIGRERVGRGAGGLVGVRFVRSRGSVTGARRRRGAAPRGYGPRGYAPRRCAPRAAGLLSGRQGAKLA